MYLDKYNPGRMPEVDCGKVSRLVDFLTLGWQVEGLEADMKAAKSTQQAYSLKIHLGSIDELKIPDKSFNAIIMNQLIGHVHKPKKNIARRRRLLKSGDKLVVVTPCHELPY